MTVSQHVLVNGRQVDTLLPEAIGAENNRLFVVTNTDSEMALVAGTAVQLVDAGGTLVGVDDIVHSLQVIDVLHHEIHEGNTFFISFKTANAAPIADDAALIFAITTGTKTLHVVSNGASGGDAEKEILEGATITGGAATTVFNRDRTSTAVTNVAAVVLNPTVNTDGTRIDHQFIPGGTGGQTVGGSGGTRNEWIFKPSTVYVVRLTNRAGTAQPASLAIEWYEE